MVDFPGQWDNALGDATQATIDVTQDAANAGADIGIGTTDWLAEGTADFGESLTDLGAAGGAATVDPVLAFAGFGGGGGGGGGGNQQNQQQNPDQQPPGIAGTGIPPMLFIAVAAVGALLLIQRGD